MEAEDLFLGSLDAERILLIPMLSCLLKITSGHFSWKGIWGSQTRVILTAYKRNNVSTFRATKLWRQNDVEILEANKNNKILGQNEILKYAFLDNNLNEYFKNAV